MTNIYKPKMYTKSVFDINYSKLKELNIKNLLFDIDNTIVMCNKKYPEKEIINLFTKLKKDGFNLYILTNALKSRALKIGSKLDVKTYYFSMKPFKKQYQRLIRENNLKIEETAAIGDQIYTDIKGANSLSIMSILIDPLSNIESILTKLNRIKEKRLITKYKIIEKRKYYE